MHRREFLKGAAALAAGAWSGRLTAQETGGGGKPNIVLIMADDFGYECVGANGGTSYRTPVLDEMAETGIRFEHCCSQPLCTPSRVQIMTGIYNVRNYVRFGLLDRDQTTFAHLLKANGYSTCIAGKWQLGREPDSPAHFGFDHALLWQHTRGRAADGHDTRYGSPSFDMNGKRLDGEAGEYGPDMACDFICDFMEAQKEKPFFVYYPMILTHCPFGPTPDSADWDATATGSKSYKGDAKYFGDMVAYTDKLVGRIESKLEDLGLRENTLVLFTGDNGTDKPIVSECNGVRVAGAKGSMTDGGTRVPLIARWPGVIPEGKVSQDLVDFSDFLPTLCEAAGARVPDELGVDGRSFLPQLKGEAGNPREWIYCWYSRDGSPDAEVWARNQRYKLYATGEFYDVSQDPLERQPVQVLAPEARQVRTVLQAAIDRYEGARPARLTRKRNRRAAQDDRE